jgi:NAD(P)-dependent dehydrogenase (short-subunit alcohol dehydrogenase family)
MKLNNQIAVITGGASGLGAAIATRFAAEGARIAIADLRPSDAFFSVVTDVSDPRAVTSLFAAVAENLGQVDILVNCAGHGGAGGSTADIDDDYWARMLAVHLNGTFYCIREALRVMQPRRRGRIINFASVAGQRGFPRSAAYSAAKSGVLGLTRSVAMEVVADGVHVNAIAPGFIDTPILQAIRPEELSRYVSQVPQQRIGTPEEIAGLALLLASVDGGYMVGQTLSPNGGLWM